MDATQNREIGILKPRFWAMANEHLISVHSLRELVRAGALADVSVVAEGDGFVVQAQVGMERRMLQAKRGHVRQFRSLDSAARLMRGLGCSRLELDLARWAPAQKSL